jgi:biopolymer transport protein ExbD
VEQNLNIETEQAKGEHEMKCLLSVCLVVAASIAACVLDNNAQTPALQKGVRVQMASTTGAAQLPEADNPNAWVVAVTASGDLYFGVEPVSPEGLLETMKSHPRNRSQELYIKADGRAAFSSVRRALESAREDAFRKVFLLTEQPSGRPSGIVPPHGMPLWVVPPSTDGGVVVQVRQGEDSPSLKVENEQVALRGLQNKLGELLRNRNNRVVVLRVGHVSFADVAHVVDVCNMAGAMPVLDMSPL